MLNKIIRNKTSFSYFYGHLGYRLFIALSLSMFVAVLDGFGISLFLPLLQMAGGDQQVDPESLGKLSYIMDAIRTLGFELTLFKVLGFMLIFFVLKGLVQFLTSTYKVTLQRDFVQQLRLNLLNLFNNLNYKAFVNLDAGRIQNTLTSEIERITQGYNFYLVTFQQGVMALVYLSFSYFIDYQFALLITFGAILTNLFYLNLFKKTKIASQKFTSDTNTFHGLISQYITNFKYLNATGLISKFGSKVFTSVKDIEKSRKNIGIYNTILGSIKEPVLITLIVSIVIIQIYFLGGNIGEILISLLFFYRALTSVASVQYFWNQYVSTTGSIDNIIDVQHNFEKAQAPENRSYNENSPIKLSLKNLGFFYGKTQILKAINLDILPFSTVAFVGESGSGKTTLLNILSGLLPVEKGKFLINEQESTSIDISRYNKCIGYIAQEPVVFNDTVFNNVAFWDKKTKHNIIKFKRALEQASLLDFVESLQNKENTMLGNNGINLSGGQKQRIAIARELYKEIEILIMDEATSSLDSETEKNIQNQIDALKGKYTILIAAHRLSTVKNADQIVFMKNGKILHIGSFEETIENVGDFKRMVELQEL